MYWRAKWVCSWQPCTKSSAHSSRDHLNGGCPGRYSGPPRSQYLGYHSIYDLVICSRNSRSGFPVWRSSSTGADRLHAHSPKGGHNGFDCIVSWRMMPDEGTASRPIFLGMRLIPGYHQWVSPLQSRLWSRVRMATANPLPAPLS